MCILIGSEFRIMAHRFADWLYTAEELAPHCSVRGYWTGLYLWVISGGFWGHPLDELWLTYEYAHTCKWSL
jgi:hypothetical protein